MPGATESKCKIYCSILKHFLMNCFAQNFLDALVFETTTYASIMKPLALQLINQFYVLDGNNDDNTASETDESGIAVLEKDLKRTIVNVLQQKQVYSF